LDRRRSRTSDLYLPQPGRRDRPIRSSGDSKDGGWRYIQLAPNVPIEIEFRGVRSEISERAVFETGPGIFTLNSSGTGLGAILNQDGTINGPLNPAASDSVIVLFATGTGATNPPSVDGSLAAVPLPQPVADLQLLINGDEAELLYVGAAPGLVAGVTQVNAKIASATTPGTVNIQLVAGGNRSATVQAIVGE